MPKAKNASKKVPSKALSASKKKASKSVTKSKSPSKAAGPKKDRKKPRYHAGTVALREIKRYQKSTDLLIPRAPFARLVRNIAGDIDNDLRFQAQALAALQEAAEAYCVGILEDAGLCAVHAKRQTLTKADMLLARRIRGDDNSDYIDRMEKSGNEVFYQLPYRDEKAGMKALKSQVKNMD